MPISVRPDVVIEYFDRTNYDDVKVTGDAFGTGPASGALPSQMAVDGFLGRGFASSFHRGDGSTGLLTLPAFKVQRKYIQFLIGGGGFAEKTCINLLSDGKVVRNRGIRIKHPARRLAKHLNWQAWDVKANLKAKWSGPRKSWMRREVDGGTSAVDQFVQNRPGKIAGLILADAALPIKVEKRGLNAAR